METVIILGAGQFGRGAARLLNQENMALLAFGDNNPALHQLTESERTEKGISKEPYAGAGRYKAQLLLHSQDRACGCV